jgi:hypothetical protein
MTTSDELHTEGVLDGLTAFRSGALRQPMTDTKAQMKSDTNCKHLASYLVGWLEGWDRGNLMSQITRF